LKRHKPCGDTGGLEEPQGEGSSKYIEGLEKTQTLGRQWGIWEAQECFGRHKIPENIYRWPSEDARREIKKYRSWLSGGPENKKWQPCVPSFKSVN
jgi:hypothetical protein